MACKCHYRVILDPRGLIHSGAPRVTTSDGVALAFDMMADDEKPETLRREVIITPEYDLQSVFDYTSKEIKAWSKAYDDEEHSIMFVVDESRFFDLKASQSFEYVLRATAPELVHVAITAHRPTDIPTDVRAISDHWLMFKTTQEHDLKVIEERCGRVVRDQVSRLDPHEFIHWNDSVGSWTSFKDPARWYVPLRSKNSPVLDSELLPDGGEVDTDKLF